MMMRHNKFGAYLTKITAIVGARFISPSFHLPPLLHLSSLLCFVSAQSCFLMGMHQPMLLQRVQVIYLDNYWMARVRMCPWQDKL